MEYCMQTYPPLLHFGCLQGIHHKLTKRELQHVFGVEEVHQVPEYELIKTEKFRKEDGGLRIRFSAWGDEYVLDLKPNSRLISPHLGTVSSHGKVPVAISDCRSLMGTLIMDDHFLVLQSVPQRIRHHNPKEHLVFKRSPSLLTNFERNIEEEIIRLNDVQEPFCDTSENMDDPIAAEILSLNYTIPSAAKLDSPFVFPNLDPITLEIGLFLDSKLFEHFQRDFIQDAEQHLLDFSLALINNVHVLYQQPTLSPNLDIVIVRYEMWKSQPSNLATFVHKNGQAQSLLDAFCRHQAHINPGTDLTDMGHWDHGVLLTGYDIYHTTASVAGVAPVARMCDQLFACSLVEGLHLGRSFVLAHEMGHNESGTGNCLRDGSPGLVERNHLQDGRTPGQRFTADQQCAYFWGRDYKVEIPSGRSMEWCHEGQCLPWTSGPPPQVIHGGWSRWSTDDRCPVQHCQITDSIAIRPQHRDCVNPAPTKCVLWLLRIVGTQGPALRGALRLGLPRSLTSALREIS
ncbi:reprolysin family zinc metalloprotease [Teladorsagia circumcincta]|uniref:Reprolysin family zinc metalloprotease n=1 Tax=Teladorsagia circumcincta TaxID=45464 RepID=A0A2G9UQY3_TELCI|nr:reprolysin family zinc metalloprotease [Teladorsagia circumcincta]